MTKPTRDEVLGAIERGSEVYLRSNDGRKRKEHQADALMPLIEQGARTPTPGTIEACKECHAPRYCGDAAGKGLVDFWSKCSRVRCPIRSAARAGERG